MKILTGKVEEFLHRKKTCQHLAALGFYLIGLYSLLSSIFYRVFAQLNIQIIRLDFPIFVGEILLFICFGILSFMWRIGFVKRDRWYRLFFLYFGWILIKALWGYFIWGPFSFRSAALFYYALFVFFGYHFYQEKLFTERFRIFVLILLLFVRLCVGINHYYLFPYFILSIILILTIKKIWLKSILFAFLLYMPRYYFPTQSFNTIDVFCFVGRTMLIGHIVAFSFLLGCIIFVFLKIRRIYKLLLIMILTIIVIIGAGHFTDKNALQSLTHMSDYRHNFKMYESEIQQQKKNFKFQPLQRNLYSQDQDNFFDYLFCPLRTTNLLKIKDKNSKEPIGAGSMRAISQSHDEFKNEMIPDSTKANNKSEENVAVDKTSAVDQAADNITAKNNIDQKEAVSNKASTVDPAVDLGQQDKLLNEHPKVEGVKYRPLDVAFNTAANNKNEKEITVDKASSADQAAGNIAEKSNINQKEAVSDKVSTFNQAVDLGQQDKLLNEHPKVEGVKYRPLDVAYNTTLFRIFIWRDMIEEFIQEKALWGINFGKPQRSKSIEILGWAPSEWQRDGWITPHNSYLHIIYRGGIVGIVIIISLFVCVFRLIKKFIKFKSITGILLSSILIYWMVLANALVFLEFPYNAIPFWSLLGLTLAYSQNLKRV